MPGHDRNKKGRQKREGNSPDKEEEAASNPDSQRKAVIFNDEIAQLQISDEQLNSLSKQEQQQQQDDAEQQQQQQRPPQKVAVRKEIPLSDRKPPVRRVGLLKRAPPDAPLKGPDATAHMGPRIDDSGRVVAHSILGSPEEFYKLAVIKGELRQEDVPELYRAQRGERRLTVKYARPQAFPFPVEDLAAEENAALKNWERRMAERKRQQGYISELTRRPANELVMNAGDQRRRANEEKHLIDRAIPFIDYGKGYRVGSEFWKQAERIGDEESGIHVTLSQTEQGFPPAIEHVGQSKVARRERGTDWVESPRDRCGRYPWKGPFYQRRTQQLRQVMDELDPHSPAFEQLEVVGRGVGHATVRSRPTTAVTPSVSQQSGRSSQAASAQLPSMHSGSEVTDRQSDGRVSGPSLLFGGQPARWFGDPATYKDTVGIEARVILETPAGRPTSQCLNIENDGSTVLFYSWKRLPKPNPFDLVQQEIRRFYFDTSNGVLLPGESLHFPFIFKSDKPGLFAEQWQLQTSPVVCGGAALVVTLRGIATQEDVHAGRRCELECRLEHQSAEKIAMSLLDEILDGLRSPERPKTPIDAYITDEEVFLRSNRGLSCTRDTLNALGRLHKDVNDQNVETEEHDWDLNVRSLRSEVLNLEEDKNTKKEDLNARLFTLVNRVSFAVDLPRTQLATRQYQLCYNVVMETMDRVFNDWHHQRAIRGLPELETEFPDPSTNTKDAKAKRGKADKQKSTVSKESAKPQPSRDVSKTAASKDRSRSPRRQQSGRLTSAEAARGGEQAAAPAVSDEVEGVGQDDETAAAASGESAEAAAERLCRERIAANTRCLLADMIDRIADLCEAAR